MGKVVLVANIMPILRRFDYVPLAYPILFKTIVYTTLAGVARLLQRDGERLSPNGNFP